MPTNQPYDPRYNAKLYIPKLTEEQRRAHATPLENLRSLRFRTAVPAAPVEVPVPAESVAQAPAPEEMVEPQEVSMSQGGALPKEVYVQHDVPARDDRPTALEVVFAEFPEIFAPQGKEPLAETRADDECLVSAGPVCNDAASDHPRHRTAYDRSHYTALLDGKSGTRPFPVPLHVGAGNETYHVPRLGTCHYRSVSLSKRVSSYRRGTIS